MACITEVNGSSNGSSTEENATHCALRVTVKFMRSYRRFGGARPACPTPRNREIGFVSSSFSFRACRACRAWRGEAAWAHLGRYPYRWASRVLGSTCSGPLGDQLLCAGVWVLSVFARKLTYRCPSFVRRRLVFKRCPIWERLLLCTGAWVLRGFCMLRCYFCAQARIF